MALLLAAGVPTDSFPHQAHRRVFASCATCHAGIVSGDSTASRPPAPACAWCHDGSITRLVAWLPSPPRPTNLRYDHRAHSRVLASRGDSALTCMSCHATTPGGAFMAVGRATPERCLTCHEPSAPSHLAAAQCGSCHRPLRDATRLTALDIAALPRPASHDSSWVFAHGREAAQASCAFCHTRESCTSCHVNAQRLAPIAALPRDPRMAAVVAGRPLPVYPRPASHQRADFTSAHGALASSAGATCANCHARESCLGCHRAGERLDAITALPRRRREGALGVTLAAARPADHVPGFAVQHRAAAAGGERTCSGCHAPSYCATCHNAEASPAFHGRNYVARHGPESFTSTTECATCHQGEAFCVSCHRETGRAAGTGARPGKYHDGQAQWAFAHGAVARRSIESCASCHRQTDCLQCHSARAGQGVSPHGRNFDPDLAAKNRNLCARCHAGGPPSR